MDRVQILVLLMCFNYFISSMQAPIAGICCHAGWQNWRIQKTGGSFDQIV